MWISQDLHIRIVSQIAILWAFKLHLKGKLFGPVFKYLKASILRCDSISRARSFLHINWCKTYQAFQNAANRVIRERELIHYRHIVELSAAGRTCLSWGCRTCKTVCRKSKCQTESLLGKVCIVKSLFGENIHRMLHIIKYNYNIIRLNISNNNVTDDKRKKKLYLYFFN